MFSFLVQLRWYLYEHRILRNKPLGCLVVVVGNLTVGGTGKTPVVEKFARTLTERGRKVAILSRGYKSKKEPLPKKLWRKLTHGEEAPPKIVSDGKTVFLDSEVAGDEPFMLANNLPGVVVLCDKNRVKAGSFAIRRFGCDTLILDDGFQHLALKRDLDILLFDHSRPLGNGHLFPAGELREPAKETRRADLVCFTRYFGGAINFDTSLLGSIPQVKTHLRLDSVICMNDDEVLDAETLKNEQVAAFCGIAQPEGFRRILLDSHIRPIFFQSFPDHHAYTLKNIKELEARAVKEGARFLLLPEKDAVKLKDMKLTLPFFKVVIELEILEGRETFNKKITAAS